MVFMTDTTERVRMEQALKQSEERYRALAENSLTGICVHQHGVHVYVNEQYAKDLGYSADELLGKRLMEVVAPQDHEMVQQIWLDRLAGQEGSQPISSEIPEKGRHREMEGSVGHGDRAQRKPGNSCQCI